MTYDWRAKEEYNNEKYISIQATLPIELLDEFTAACKEDGVSKNSIITAGIIKFLEDNE